MSFKKKADVAVLLASFNGEKYIVEQIESINAQTDVEVDIYVSDDFSTDRTRLLLSEMQRTGSIKEIFDGPQEGYANNFLQLAKLVPKRYQFYAFADQDDVWLPHKLLTAISILSGCPNNTPALFCSSVKLIDSDGNYIGSSNIIHKKPSFANALVESIAAGHTMVFNLSLIKIFTQIPPDRKVTSHDWMLYQLCTGFNGQVYCYPRPLVCYRQHSTNVIGDGRSIHVFAKRLLFFFNGRFKTRLDANARLLEKFVGQFEASSQKTFFQSQRIRQANICLRLMVWRLPLKRQSYLETWLVRVGVLFGLV